MKKNNFVRKLLTPIILIFLISICFVDLNYYDSFNSMFTNNNLNNSSIEEKNNKSRKELMDTIKVNSNFHSYDNKVYVGGFPIGIKMNTDGVLVVGFSDIEIENNKIESPARKSGIEIGDTIKKVNNKSIDNSKDLQRRIQESDDKNIIVEINRDGKSIKKKIAAVHSNLDNSNKIGLWVRDSTAGVGTMTFYNPRTNVYGALGHPITDVDTNSVLKVRSGELLDSSIIGVKKGEKGSPGELKGVFVNDDESRGDISSNTYAGIYGHLEKNQSFNYMKQLMEVAPRKKVHEGKAKILTTVDENGPCLYDVEIVKLFEQEKPDTKSMVIKVVDKKLLEKTGGIVQGMSGSPIIQDNKLVGAVTHVLINRADVGYGIYIDWMIEESNRLN